MHLTGHSSSLPCLSLRWRIPVECSLLQQLCPFSPLWLLHTELTNWHKVTALFRSPFFLSMATRCFSTAAVITYEWWCCCNISQKQRSLIEAAVWVTLKKECALFLDLAQSLPHATSKALRLMIRVSVAIEGCVCVFADPKLDVRFDHKWLIMGLFDAQTHFLLIQITFSQWHSSLRSVQACIGRKAAKKTLTCIFLALSCFINIKRWIQAWNLLFHLPILRLLVGSVIILSLLQVDFIKYCIEEIWQASSVTRQVILGRTSLRSLLSLSLCDFRRMAALKPPAGCCRGPWLLQAFMIDEVFALEVAGQTFVCVGLFN